MTGIEFTYHEIIESGEQGIDLGGEQASSLESFGSQNFDSAVTLQSAIYESDYNSPEIIDQMNSQYETAYETQTEYNNEIRDMYTSSYGEITDIQYNIPGFDGFDNNSDTYFQNPDGTISYSLADIGSGYTEDIQVKSKAETARYLNENGELAYYQSIFSKYSGTINNYSDLRIACRNEGIDIGTLQKALGFSGRQVNGNIERNTFTAFKNYILTEPAMSTLQVDGSFTMNSEQKEMARGRIEDIENLRNREYLEALNLPKNFQIIGKKFLNRLRGNEILSSGDPLALVDGNTQEMIYIIDGKWQKFPVLLGKGGLSKGYSSGDRKTITGKIHRFDPSISKLANSVNGDASNRGSKTVKSASLQSALSQSSGGRYFHGVADYRIRGRNNGMGTWGCVGVDVHTIRDMYSDVQQTGGGFGYVDVA